MRIITGKARGTKLSTLTGDDTRPTAERVKEAMFSSIQFELADRRVLDLFGGSGQLALEALSRGASSAVVVDNNKKATEVIRANAIKTNMLSECRVICTDWRDFIKTANQRLGNKEKFSLLILDPPYKAGFLDEVIKRVSAADILAENCLIVCESAEDGVPLPPDGYTAKLYKHGNVFVTVMRPAEEEE